MAGRSQWRGFTCSYWSSAYVASHRGTGGQAGAEGDIHSVLCLRSLCSQM